MASELSTTVQMEQNLYLYCAGSKFDMHANAFYELCSTVLSDKWQKAHAYRKCIMPFMI